MSALDTQVGGSHYKGFAIQPVEFITKNDIGFLPGCIIKRACRFDKPGGKGMQDLEKIKHEVDLLIELCLSQPSVTDTRGNTPRNTITNVTDSKSEWEAFWKDLGIRKICKEE